MLSADRSGTENGRQQKSEGGLDVGENFNLAKSENTRQPQCTPEKEDAIMQAFRHFGII